MQITKALSCSTFHHTPECFCNFHCLCMSSIIICYFCSVVLIINSFNHKYVHMYPNATWSKKTKQTKNTWTSLKLEMQMWTNLTSHLRLVSDITWPRASTLENDAHMLISFIVFHNIHENSKSSQMLSQNELDALILEISTV